LNHHGYASADLSVKAMPRLSTLCNLLRSRGFGRQENLNMREFVIYIVLGLELKTQEICRQEHQRLIGELKLSLLCLLSSRTTNSRHGAP
jgi:hypothetical protein